MDDKASRRSKAEEYGRRHKQAKKYGHKIWAWRKIRTFLKDHKNGLFTGFMFLAIVVLLFGIFSQLQPPATNTVPGGETAIDYSTFVKQVNAGNMLAVVMRGDEINGLLSEPLDGKRTLQPAPAAAPATKSVATDFAAWSRYVGVGNPSWSSNVSSSGVDPARSVYTHLPAGGDATLMALLLSKHVNISTLPISQTAGWLTLFWRFLPIFLMIVFVLIFMTSRNNARSMRPLDDRITQIGRSRARRFERVKETTPEARKTAVESRKPTTPVAAGATNRPPVTKISTEPSVTFADVAGIDEVRTELEEIVQFLRSPERYNRLGARIPRGALLVGPPGTGKTLLARAVAGEANVPFFSMSASEFVEMYVGVGASRVRDLFNQARQSAPCVIFIDEIDAVGRKRSMRVAGNDERDQTLNQLLVELDGFDTRKAVVVLAATNRADILDTALLRPGRFDRRITVSLPDRAGREAILKVHARNTPLEEDVSLTRLARLSTGMSGADLANLVNEAALSAARRDLEKVSHECFEDALARVQLGALRPIVMSEEERRIIAYHEGGHALVAYHLPEADSVNRVTILPRGQSLGVTQFTAEEDRYNYSREMLMARIAVGLGGRAAEELTFGLERVTTGAENDLQVVTNLARRMVTRWGMSEQVGVVFADYRAEDGYSLNMRSIDPGTFPAQARSLIADAHGNLHLNGDLPTYQYAQAMAVPASAASGVMMQSVIDAEVQCILNEGRTTARELLRQHYDQLQLLAEALMEHEQLDRAQFESLLKGQG